MSFKCKLRISHHRMKQVLNKFRIKLCPSSYFSLPAKLLLIQSGTFGPIRAPPGRFDNIVIVSKLVYSFVLQISCTWSAKMISLIQSLTYFSKNKTKKQQQQKKKKKQMVKHLCCVKLHSRNTKLKIGTPNENEKMIGNTLEYERIRNTCIFNQGTFHTVSRLTETDLRKYRNWLLWVPKRTGTDFSGYRNGPDQTSAHTETNFNGNQKS